ncbi:MAG: cytochrome c oxidase subunit II [Azospirillum sp.]|nr:cytochrome c oxidase subunit II [Azospirillum sp.]
MMTRKIGAVAATILVILVGFAGLAHAEGWVGMAHPWQLGLQEAATSIKAHIDSFHNLLLVIITVITVFVMALLAFVMVRFNAKANPTPSRNAHNTLIEVIWTVVPVIVLVIIAVPSFKLLYFEERIENAELTIKATGRQWYWDYEYPDNGGFSFSSYIIPDSDLKPGQHRLLDVDNRVVLPVDTNIRVQITAGDVLHSWAVPAFGVKKDAVPGRLNELWFRVDHEGVYYGQCSELCGTNHGFMPIAVEIVSKEKFAEWVAKAKVAFGTGDASPAPVQLAAGPAAVR